MNVTLQLVYRDAPQRPAAAWLVPGATPAAWLAEMTAWGVPLAEAKLLVIADAGLLVWLPAGSKLHRPGGAIAYGRIAERALVPVEAAIDPPVTERELAALLAGHDALFVWHPRLGLSCYEADEVLCVADLLVPPPISGERLDAGQPGTAFNQRLLSIEPTHRPTLEDVIEAARGNIGTQPLAGGKLPAHPLEPVGGAIGQAVTQAGLSAAAAAAGAMAAGAQSLAGMLGAGGAAASHREAPPSRAPAAAGGPNWLQRLANWAKEQQQAAASQLDRLRHKQLERLLHMLEASPDQGLKFAIPFGGSGGMHRGLARPGASLMERNVDFSLARLGGGGAADYWDLPEEYRRKLLEQYRALANREISLGRHRRAAYIFAELLGDLTTAASTLAAGGHFREAAVLYEQRLHQPLSAARCLAQGGLLAEAIAIYERLRQWETVAELYEKLDQLEAADRAYRAAVEMKLSTNDYLAAAQLLEHKLREPLVAQRTLCDGWQGGQQSRGCLEASFDLLARHSLHDMAGRQVGELRGALSRSSQAAPAATVLARTARQYPQPEVCQSAAEATRFLVSERIPQAPPAESKDLLDALASLVPADRLLSRDCDQYLAERREDASERRRREVASRQARRAQVRVVHQFALRRAEWRSVVSTGEQFFAAGWMGHHLALAHGNWAGSFRVAELGHLRVTAQQQQQPILLAADPRRQSTLWVHVARGVPDARVEFSQTDAFPHQVIAAPHPGCDDDSRVLVYGPGGTVLIGRFVAEGGAEVALVLTPYDGQRPLPGVQAVRFELEDLPDLDYIERQPLPFYCHGADYYLGIGRRLIHKRLRQTTCEVPSPIVSITGSAPHSRTRIVLGCEEGGAVLWGESAAAPHTAFAADLVEPVVGINRGGWLIAATSETVEVFSTANGKLNFLATAPAPANRPLAVLATDHNQRFAIVSETGQASVYEIPPR